MLNAFQVFALIWGKAITGLIKSKAISKNWFRFFIVIYFVHIGWLRGFLFLLRKMNIQAGIQQSLVFGREVFPTESLLMSGNDYTFFVMCMKAKRWCGYVYSHLSPFIRFTSRSKSDS